MPRVGLVRTGQVGWGIFGGNVNKLNRPEGEPRGKNDLSAFIASL